jgi:nitroimidazol reductase NimA-like FMN-containing flavoprotein (pyridoxamine 5'-phosphate oxidase superfamily)
MVTEEIDETACVNLLKRAEFGRLACSQDLKSYVVPVSFAYDGGYLYSFSIPGRKTEWMQTNPHVCMQVDEIVSRHEWISVVAMGRFEELHDTPDFAEERDLAFRLMQERAQWWEPGSFKLKTSEHQVSQKPIWYRIGLGEITGRRAGTPKVL